MKVLIRANYYQLAQTRHFDKLHAERDEQWLDPPTKCFAHHICQNRSIIKAVWQCSTVHSITKTIHTELSYIRIQCVKHISAPNDRYDHSASTLTVHLTHASNRMPPQVGKWEVVQGNFNIGGKSTVINYSQRSTIEFITGQRKTLKSSFPTSWNLQH